MTCTKGDLIDSIYLENEFSKNISSRIVESVFDILKDSLASGDDVLISKFGKFYLTNKKTRRGRNPATGSELTLEARRIVSFKCSDKLRLLLNE